MENILKLTDKQIRLLCLILTNGDFVKARRRYEWIVTGNLPPLELINPPLFEE